MSSPNRSTRAPWIALGLSIWLGIQYLVIGMTPSWGAVVPHTHILRGAVSEAQWQKHFEQHRHSWSIHSFVRCESPRAASAEAIMASIPANDGIVSLWGLAFDCDARGVSISAVHVEWVPLALAEFCTWEMFFTPLEPPPKL